MESFYFKIAVVLSVCSLCSSFPSGAPEVACMNMFPKHGGAQSRLDSADFVIEADVGPSGRYSTNVNYQITVSSKSGKTFKGIILAAHSVEVNSEVSVGQFSNTFPPNKFKLLDCTQREKNVITHNNSQPVKSLTATWTAPSTNLGNIIFTATIVESFDVFHFGIKSDLLLNPDIDAPAIEQSKVLNNMSSIDWDDCDDTKGCLLYPRYCTGSNCRAALSFSDNKDGTFTFELMAHSDGYVAVGFSHDRTMGADQTITCTSDFERVSIQNGYNNPGSSKFNVRKLGLNLTNLEAAGIEDGKIICRFTRPKSMLLEMGNTFTEFNLDDEYYLFLAWGPTYQLSDVIGMHHELPVISDTKVDFSDHSVYRGSVMPQLIRAHSTLMTLAWLAFAALAFIMPRYYKEGFDDKKICGVKIWFHIHRTCAMLTFALTVAGLVVVLVKLDGEITEKDSAHTHMCLGFTVVALVCAQLLGGLLRPGLDSKIRPLFNVFHKLFGASALIIAAAAIIYAYRIDDFSPPMQKFGERTVAVWAGVFVFMEVLMFGYQYLATRYKVSRSDEYNLDKDADVFEFEDPVNPSTFLFVLFVMFFLCSIVAAIIMTTFF